MVDDLEEAPVAAGFCNLLHRPLRGLAGRILCDLCNVDDRYRITEFARIGDRATIKVGLTLGVHFYPASA